MISRAEIAIALSGSAVGLACACASVKSEPITAPARRDSKSSSRVIVPIEVRPKYATPHSSAIAVAVRFGSIGEAQKTLDLELDTGSSGLAVFASSLAGVRTDRIGQPFSKTYGGGDVYEEQSAKISVSI